MDETELPGQFQVYDSRVDTSISESTKSQVSGDRPVWDKRVGSEHPFDFERLEKWYKDDAFVHGMIDKYVQFTVGQGMFFAGKDERLNKILKEFVKKNQFQVLLADFLTEAFVTGNGFMELSANKIGAIESINVIDPKTMYVRRDLKGKIEGYTQWFGTQAIINGKQAEPVFFETNEIAHLTINSIGNAAYGTGIVFPLLYSLTKKTQLLRDMTMLMSRKANNPIIITMGSTANNWMPSEAQITAVGKKLEWLNNKHEWVFGPGFDFKAVDFGNVGDKFVEPIKLINEELFYGSQIPAVIMGAANVPEGLAKEQMKAFLLIVSSYQERLEKILEEQIFKKIALANGFNPEDVEIDWNIVSNEEKDLEIKNITSLLGLYMSGGINDLVRNKLLARLSELMELEIEEDDIEKEKEKEETEPQPRVPPIGLKRPVLDKEKEPEEHIHEMITETNIDEFFKDLEDKTNNLTLKEYVGFNYFDFIEDINEFVNSKEFMTREFTTFRYIPGTQQTKWDTIISKYKLTELLTISQIKKLRGVLIDSFNKGSSMGAITKSIFEEVKPEILKITIPALYDSQGKLIRSEFERELSSRQRSVLIARTETIRASNEGSLINFEKNGIENVQWIAAIGERTCDACAENNGKIMTIEEAHEQLPYHNNCRCSYAPIVTK